MTIIGTFAGFMTGLFFVSTAFGVAYLFERRSVAHWALDAAYQVLLFTGMGRYWVYLQPVSCEPEPRGCMANSSRRPRSRRARFQIWLLPLTSGLLSCTYGPPEHRAVAHAARVDSTSTRMAAVVHHEIFRPPTGLSAFPDGGVARTTVQEVFVYGGDAATRSLHLWQRREVDREVWTSLSMAIVGAAPDTVYLALSGCPAEAAECWGPGRARVLTRFTADGSQDVVGSVPSRHRVRPQTEAPEPGETKYLRLQAVQHDTIRAGLVFGADRVPLFRVLPTGVLVPVGP